MPTYQYECKSCGKTFDHFQKMSDEPLQICILCSKKGKLKRLIGTGAGIIFKGSGFYETDYKRKSGKENKENSTNKDNAPSKAKEEKNTAPKSDVKTKQK